MLNYIWLSLIVLGVIIAGFGGRMQPAVDGAVQGAETAVTLAIGLVGLMALWLGVMRLAEKSGLVQLFARWLRPVLTRLFPDVPPEHPALGAMVMNIAANMLGLNNAATPLGLRAMKDLQSLNPLSHTATNAMCTFLAINTSSVQLLPLTAVAILASAGSQNPTAIIGTAFLATLCSTVAGLVAVKTLERLPVYRAEPAPATIPAAPTPAEEGLLPESQEPTLPTRAQAKTLPPWGWLVLASLTGCFLWFFIALTFPETFGQPPPSGVEAANTLVRAVNAISLLSIPFLLAAFPLYAALRGIPVYEEFVEGAKEGFLVALRIIPFLVAMLVAIGLFRGAGGIDMLTRFLRPALEVVHFPPELLPMSLIRPLSGSGSMAVFADLVKTYGPDHILSRMAATLFGSTETTFYVVVVYFGSVGVRRTRHAIPAGLIADGTGIIASIIICRLVFN